MQILARIADSGKFQRISTDFKDDPEYRGTYFILMKNTATLLTAFACISLLASCSQSPSSTTPSATLPETSVVASSENQDIVTTPVSTEIVPTSNTTTPVSQKTTATPTVTVSKTDTPAPQNNAKTTTKTISYRTPSHQ